VCVALVLKDELSVPMGVDWLRDVMDHHPSNYIKRITALRLSFKPTTYMHPWRVHWTLWQSAGSDATCDIQMEN